MFKWRAAADDLIVIYILMLAALFIIGGGILAFATCGISLVLVIPGFLIFWAAFKRSFWLKPPPEPKYAYYYPYTPFFPPLPPHEIHEYRIFTKRFYRKLNMPPIKILLTVFLIAIVIGAVVLLTIETWFGVFAWAPFIFVFVIAFSFPSFIWIALVYHKDVFTPEPARNMMLVLTWGMLSVIPAIIGEILLGAFWIVLGFEAVIVGILSASIDAPFVEEFCKPLGLRFVRFDVNTKLDGLIYGVTAGMGFAMIENMLYEFSVLTAPVVEFTGGGELARAVSASWALTSLIRGLGSTIGHAVGAGMIGMAFYTYRNSPNRPIIPLVGAYSFAVVLHMSWNGVLSLMDYYNLGDIAAIPFIVGFPILELYILLRLIKIAKSEEPEVLSPRKIKEKFDIPEVPYPPPYSYPPPYMVEGPIAKGQYQTPTRSHYPQQMYTTPHITPHAPPVTSSPLTPQPSPQPYYYPYYPSYPQQPYQKYPSETQFDRKVRCPRCHQISRIPPREYGNDMVCPFCGIIFRHPY